MKKLVAGTTEKELRCQRAHIAAGTFESVTMATMSGVFFTLLVKQMGVSDAVTGTLSTVANLGCVMQLFAVVFIRRIPSVRTSTMVIQTIEHLLKAFLYLLPFLRIGPVLRIVLFSVAFVSTSLLGHLIVPARFHWMMSFVPNGQRGVFSSRKEIISLAATIIYNLIMGRVVDYFISLGKTETGLMLCAVAILIIYVGVMVSMMFTQDAPQILAAVKQGPPLQQTLRCCLGNPTLLKLAFVGLCWNFFCFFSNSFHSVFLLQELHCSATFIVIAGMTCNIIRIVVSIPFGHFADRFGFDQSMKLGFIFAAVSFGILIFWNPVNGKILYMLYQFPFACVMSTLSSALMNIIMQYIPQKDLVSSQSVYSAINGASAFIGSLAGGSVLAAIQKNGNRVFGISMYGQQCLCLISCIAMICLAIYVHTVVQKIPRLTD